MKVFLELIIFFFLFNDRFYEPFGSGTIILEFLVEYIALKK